MKEIWAKVKEDPRYEVSNLGRVRNSETGRVLKQMLNQEHGYLRVNICGGHRYVHRLVADAFYDGEHKNMDVNHIDGNKANNALSNLEYCTRKDNIRHAFINGLKYPTVVRVVRCKFCKHRYEYDFCEGKPDDFYCSNGER